MRSSFRKKSRGAVNSAGLMALVVLSMIAAITFLASPSASAQIDDEAPGRPGLAGPGATSTTVDSVTIAWTASTDNTAVTGYRVELRGVETVTAAAGATSHTFTAVAPGTYQTVISALDAAGNESTRRSMWLQVMTPAEQTATAATAQVIATAVEAFITDGNDFVDLGGYLNLGYGWFNRDNPSYPTNIATTLINGGYLDLSFEDTPWYQFAVYHCGTGANRYAAVFTFMPTDSTITPTGPNTWTTCAQSPFRNAHPHYTTTETKRALVGGETVRPTQPGLAAAGASSITSDSVTLAWTPSTDNVAVTDYRVELRGHGALNVDATETSHTFTSVAPGTYPALISALDAAGNESTRRLLWIQVLTPLEQDETAAAAEEIAAAIEAFVSDGNDFTDLGGYLGLGYGWFNRTDNPSYPTNIATTLIDGGYLSLDYELTPYYQFAIYRCRNGEDRFAGVFTFMPTDTLILPTGPNSWDGCTESPFRFVHPHYTTTATKGELQFLSEGAPAWAPGAEITIEDVNVDDFSISWGDTIGFAEEIQLTVTNQATGEVVHQADVLGPFGGLNYVVDSFGLFDAPALLGDVFDLEMIAVNDFGQSAPLTASVAMPAPTFNVTGNDLESDTGPGVRQATEQCYWVESEIDIGVAQEVFFINLFESFPAVYNNRIDVCIQNNKISHVGGIGGSCGASDDPRSRNITVFMPAPRILPGTGIGFDSVKVEVTCNINGDVNLFNWHRADLIFTITYDFTIDNGELFLDTDLDLIKDLMEIT